MLQYRHHPVGMLIRPCRMTNGEQPHIPICLDYNANRPDFKHQYLIHKCQTAVIKAD